MKLEHIDIRTSEGKINTEDAGLFINPEEITIEESEAPEGEESYFAKLTLPRYKPKADTGGYEKAADDGAIIYVKAWQAPRLKEYLLNQPVTKIEFPCMKCGRELKLDLAKLKLIFPNGEITQTHVDLLNRALQKGNFNTCKMNSHFFSQIYVESDGFTNFIEGRGYSLDVTLIKHSNKVDVKKIFFKRLLYS